METRAQMIVRERINIFAEMGAEYRKDDAGGGGWRLDIAKEADLIARELRDVLRVLEVVGA